MATCKRVYNHGMGIPVWVVECPDDTGRKVYQGVTCKNAFAGVFFGQKSRSQGPAIAQRSRETSSRI